MLTFEHDGQRIIGCKDGEVLAEITFPSVREGVWSIDHTFVDPSLRGQGIAGQLVQKVAALAKEQGMKLEATCPYAVTWLERHPQA